MAEKARDNVVFIGKKPSMSYVLATMAQFNNGSAVTIRARGNSIGKAVDVAEIIRNKFIQSAKVKDIKISTEKMESKTKQKVNVSVIEISLTK